jgi:hypothetical protein
MGPAYRCFRDHVPFRVDGESASGGLIIHAELADAPTPARRRGYPRMIRRKQKSPAKPIAYATIWWHLSRAV